MIQNNTDWTVRMSRGDDVQIPLIINNGTRLNPLRYEFDINDGCEVYFYLIDPDKPCLDYVLKKTFNSDGTIKTDKPGQEQIVETGFININDKKDIVIRLNHDDTNNLKAKRYIYQIKALVLTSKINNKNLVVDSSNEYSLVTITNKYDFYIIDDDYNRAWN